MKKLLHFSLMMALCFSSLSLVACSDDDGDSVEAPEDENDNEVITTVQLTFTPTAGGDTVSATWLDADGDGGGDPVIDPIKLAADTDYTVDIVLTNELASPAEDITAEVEEEGAEHQLFFAGDDIQSPNDTVDANLAAFEYGDVDEDGLPIGLLMDITTGSAGSSELQVILRHMPLVDGEAVKVEDLEDLFIESGTTNLPGNSDFDINFEFEVE